MIEFIRFKEQNVCDVAWFLLFERINDAIPSFNNNLHISLYNVIRLNDCGFYY